MIGVDTSFLVAFEISTHPLHAVARGVAARHAGEPFALAPQVLAEFIHVVTDPRRFERPLAAGEAVARSARWWSAVETHQVFPGPEAVTLFHDWMREFGLGRKRLLDTLLAATYKTAGIGIIVSSDARDFAAFPGIHPLVIR
jgi:predicted nucleic acid-binding protein